MKTLTIGTRGSKLALWQSRHVAGLLEAAQPGLAVRLQVIKTQGDREARLAPRHFSDKGIFVKEIEEALLAEEVDLAVHSMKDVPSEQPEGLGLVAFPERVDCRDALVTRDAVDVDGLPEGARVGTSSLRRMAQLARHRPDLRFQEMRGNVDTRLRKLADGEVDAVVLAMAGLTRLGLAADLRRPVPPDICLPAPGQGVLALETRLADGAVRALVERLDHAPTRRAVTAERKVLEVLDAGCLAPMAALARGTGDDGLEVCGMVASPDGSTLLKVRVTGSAADSAALGRQVAEKLRADGADRVLEDARRRAFEEDGS